jgi:hypothetical protein
MSETPSGEDEQETKYSPAGFEAPEPELENGEVICAGCGEVGPVNEMGVTADSKTETESGTVAAITRYYLHNDEDCTMRFMGADDAE